jgi:hypothetical protein
MHSKEIGGLLARRPFQPFRVHLTDGRSYEIRHPEINLITQSTLVIGVPVPDDPDPFADHFVRVPITEILRLEPLPQTEPASH